MNTQIKCFLLASIGLIMSNSALASTLNSYEKELFNEINAYRQKNNLKPLAEDNQLNLLARQHSLYMQERKTLSHDGFKDRFKASQHRECVENVGWNYKTGKAMFEGWRTSSGHNVNMLNSNIKLMGLAKVGDYITFFACR